MNTVIIILTSIFIVYLVISNYIRYKHNNQEIKNIVYQYSRFIFPKASREGIIGNLINAERINRLSSKLLLYTLLVDSEIVRIAKYRAEAQVNGNNLSHRGASKAFIELNELGADGSSEILAYGYESEDGAVYGWLKSKAHRKAMLDPDYDYFGVSCKKDTHGKWVDVVIFVNENTI
jgi:hypothetical protein